jgi:hypothetical protein
MTDVIETKQKATKEEVLVEYASLIGHEHLRMYLNWLDGQAIYKRLLELQEEMKK